MSLLKTLERARTIFGDPILAEDKQNIWAFIVHPTAKTWDDISWIMIGTWNGSVSLLQAVAHLDSKFTGQATYAITSTPEERWPTIPNRFMVARALKEIVDSNGR
jgi:hypothetical protein